MNALIAVVDDENDIRETISYSLKKEGLAVALYPDGMTAWEAFQKAMPDIIILDIIMPRMDGLELCRKIRTISDSVNILFLSSKDDEFDRVLGLQIGGDDYMCKPFSIRELTARIHVMIRRMQLVSTQTEKDQILSRENLKLDTKRYSATWNGIKLQLTITEFMLLHCLVRYPGHIKTRNMLIDEVYPHNTYVSDRTIDSHIKRLRKKFADIDDSFSQIETVYGMGYRFICEN